jgi:hypothetical protein
MSTPVSSPGPAEHRLLKVLAARYAEAEFYARAAAPEPRGDRWQAGSDGVADVRDTVARALPEALFCSCRAGFPW